MVQVLISTEETVWKLSFCTMSDKAWLSFCAFKITRQITNLRMQDSDQQTEVADRWDYQRSLSLVSSDHQAGVVELLALNPSSDHEQQRLYHQLHLWLCWWFFAHDFFVFRIWYSTIYSLSLGMLNRLQRVLDSKLKLTISDYLSLGTLNRLSESLIKNRN